MGQLTFLALQSMPLREMTSRCWWRGSPLAVAWSLNLNVQVFIEGDPDNEEQYFLNTDDGGANSGDRSMSGLRGGGSPSVTVLNWPVQD